MATKAQLFTYLAHTANRYAFLKTQGKAASPDYLELVVAQQILNYGENAGLTTHLEESVKAWEAMMTAFDSEIDEILGDIALKYGASRGSIEQMWPAIWQGMTDGTETIKNRAWSRGSVGSWTGTGSGKLWRSTKDKSDQVRESGKAQVTRAEVVRDKNTGGTESGREILALGGVPTGTPDIGPLRPGTILPRNFDSTFPFARAVDGLLANPSFEDGTGEGASTTAITSWTAIAGTLGTHILRNAATAAADADAAPFRNAPGQTTGRSVKLTGTGTITLEQKFSVNRVGARIDRSRPVLWAVPIRPSTGTAFQGTAIVRLGSKTATLAHGAMAGGWEWLSVAFDNDDSWYDNFKEDDVRCSIGLSAYTQGHLDVDEAVLIQPVLYNGTYWIATAGQTDMLTGAYVDVTDTVSDTGEIQTMLAERRGIYLPHTSGSPTYADV